MSTWVERRVNDVRWRLLPLQRGPSDVHVALSDVLVRQVRVPTLWWHTTECPTVILGSAQAWSDVDHEACQASGIRVVKRHAGGTAVFADEHVLGLDIALPASHTLTGQDVVETYRWIGETWREALQLLGIAARTLTVAEARLTTGIFCNKEIPLGSLCFGGVSPYEVFIGSRKVVGLAQVRRRAGTLIQSGIQTHLEVDRLVRVLPVGDKEKLAAELRARAVGLDEVTEVPLSLDHIIRAFQEVLADRHGVSFQPDSWTSAETLYAEEVRRLQLPPAAPNVLV